MSNGQVEALLSGVYVGERLREERPARTPLDRARGTLVAGGPTLQGTFPEWKQKS